MSNSVAEETGVFIAEWLAQRYPPNLDIDFGDDSTVPCARCGYFGIYDYNDTGLDRGIKHRDDFPSKYEYFGRAFCDECANALMPYAHRMHDIEALATDVNKLERAIRGKRSENDRTTSHDASERSKGSAERRSSNR